MAHASLAEPHLYSFGLIRLSAEDLRQIVHHFAERRGAVNIAKKERGYAHVDFHRVRFSEPMFPPVGQAGRVNPDRKKSVILTRILELGGDNFDGCLREALNCFEASDAVRRTMCFYFTEKPAIWLSVSSGQFLNSPRPYEWTNGMIVSPRGHTEDIEAKRQAWIQTLHLSGFDPWIRVDDSKPMFTFQPVHPDITFHVSGSAPVENQRERLPTQLNVDGFPNLDSCSEILRTANRNGLIGLGKFEYSASRDWPVPDSIVDAVNDVASCWDISYTADYPSDPFELPTGLPAGDYRCPVVLIEHPTKLRAHPQIDVLHLKSGEVCLEFTTVGGPKHLKKLAKEVDCEIEIWQGAPEDRWGDG